MPARSEVAAVGVIGCGDVSRVYLENLRRMPHLRVVACADLDPERARRSAEALPGARCLSPDRLLADPDVAVIVNLTPPAAHARVNLAAVQAGKHVYSEKPLAGTPEEATEILARAAEGRVRVGAAPDTVLGPAWQQARQALDAGMIGRPVAATAFMTCHGHETWHPNPDFYYQVGGGPLLDMGPYYLTALVSLLGPVVEVAALAGASFSTRTIGSAARQGETLPVEVPTHVSASLRFAAGPLVTLVTSFDVWHAHLPAIEIYGAEGTLSLPDPNAFDGPIGVRKAADSSWATLPQIAGPVGNARGLGVAELVEALGTETMPRASGELGAHVVDVMAGVLASAEEGRRVRVATSCRRPEPLTEEDAARLWALLRCGA